MKRWIALLLSLVLILSVIPVSYARPAESAPAEDVWETIQAIEDRLDSRVSCTDLNARTAAYSGAVDEIIAAVVASSAYVPGSLVRHGDFFYWDETDGTACGYSPRLRAQIREGADPNADPEAYSGIETVSYATKGGSPSSVNVAAFQPYIGIDTSFTAQYENRCKAIAQALGGTGTTYKTTNATIDNIAHAIESCAVVIFDSHGDTDYASGSDYTSRANTSYLCLQSGTGITAEDQATVTGPYGTYKHAYYGGSYGSMQYYMVDGTAISNHMTGTSPNGFLWMAICLGMATDGMHAPLRAKGVEVAYGYSQSVSFTGDYKYDGFFWPYMCDGHDVAESAAYMKQKFNNRDTYVTPNAWPIFVSSEDVYPGHGNVDKYQAVNSTWTLFEQFSIHAVSNNDDWGTVSLSGNTITATPKEGYLILGYEVTEGEAEVTQNENTFSVNPLSDCTVQINFAPRTPAVVNFSTPDGVTCESISCYTYDTITLPEPTGTPTADAHVYRFLGWAEAPMNADSLELPSYQRAGASVTVTEPEKTYYALYSYFVADNGTADDEFTLLTEEPASWAGYYVITYNGSVVLDASGAYTGTNIGTSKAAHPLSEYGVTVDGDVLVNVPDEIVYEFVPAEDGAYGIKMKTGELFLSLPTDSNSLTTAANCSKAAARWQPSMTNGIVRLVNSDYTSRWLQYNTSAKLFRAYTTQQGNLSLYTRGEGETWITTSPQNKNECENHVFGDWITVTEPTCTEDGSQKHVCAVCGYTETEEIPALGHDYQAVVTEPTCTEAGYTTYTCSRCGDSYTGDETAALGHDYETVVTAPTCTEAGYTTYTCSRCGDSYTADETAALGHDYQAVVTEPTCTEAGYTTYTCTRCGDSYTEAGEEALGHDWDEGVVTLEPTTEAEGIRTYTCRRCGETKTEPIPMLEEPPFRFDDVQDENAFYFDPVYWAYNHVPQITKGTDPTHFSPNNKCTRAEAVTFLWRAANCPSYEAAENPFRDVSTSAWYYDAVMWAVSEGITKGVDATHFAPNNTCSRAEIVTFLMRAQKGVAPEDAENPFADVGNNSWYRDAVLWAVSEGITNGVDKTHFAPNKVCTRGEIVTFLYRVYADEA